MIKMSSIHPDRELKEILSGSVFVANEDGDYEEVTVYSDWERPTNKLPNDFIVVYVNGNIGGIGTNNNYAEGALIVSLYCKLNDDGSVKMNRIENILDQFDTLVEGAITSNYFYRFSIDRYITPTTLSQSTGYSITSLNLEWHTNNNFNS